MTNHTPRDSAQLPPHFLQSGVFSGEHHKWVIDYAERYATEALRAQAASSPATAVDAVELLQAGLSNDDLRAAFESKLPGVNPTERDLSIFALGAEVGAHELATERQSTRMYFEERNSARDAWRRAASCRDELRAALQASRQPQAQQAVAEGAGDVTDAQIEAGAKAIAVCMDYPWDHMPEQGRQLMRLHAATVIQAATKEANHG